MVLAAVPGVPVLGNLLQLKEKKPYMTFTKWAKTYGPIYSIKTGASTLVVLNTTEFAKEVPSDLFSIISLSSLRKNKSGTELCISIIFRL